ncbi:GSH0-like protein [Mya arenaria]|uniref:GCS light chain n=1 Tax=Mya arenaria TaxID=6604 RepID=A0ABY7ET22_MYAAR|nr:GSH0-like protein [Mya arenaria]
MAEDIPVVPKAGSLLLNSGNIVNWNRLKRKPSQSPTISECIGTTFQAFINGSDKNELQYLTDLNCVHQKYKETVPKADRGDFKLTVKIFLCSLLPTDVLQEAVDKVLSELDVSFIETVIVAFPEVDNEELTLEVVQPYWKALETLVYRETVISLGLADFDKKLLEQLYEWAEVKPMVNQVNLESCCVMPKELVEFAKEKDIQLLTHNDPREKDGEGWDPLWVLRYSVLVKCRGIVKSKGYLLKAERDVRKRK